MNRRNFIHSISALGCSTPFLGAENKIILNPKAKAKSVIYIFVAGGLSQYDSFNLQVNKDVLGKAEVHKSNADGIAVSQYFPHMAKCMDKFTVINSLKNNQGAHPSGIYKMLTGYNPRSSITHPQIGAWISKTMTQKSDSLPNFISVSDNKSGSAGFFPGRYAALPVGDPKTGINFIERHKAVSEKKFEKRMNLLDSLNNDFNKRNGTRETQAYIDTYKDTLSFMNSKHIDAFDLSKEDKNIAKLYKNEKFSQGCMLAARLVERGVRFTKVTTGGWDYHDGIYEKFPANAANLDHGTAALIKHLELKGLLETTLVVVSTEFGRSPNVNVNKGRDHHPNGFTCLMAGGGVKGGFIYGKTSKDGKSIAESEVTVADFNATIAYALGVNPDYEEMSPSGRPFKLGNKGKPVKEIFA